MKQKEIHKIMEDLDNVIKKDKKLENGYRGIKMTEKKEKKGCGRQVYFDGNKSDYCMCGDFPKNSKEIFICHSCRGKK